MKLISILVLIAAVSACSTHPVKCHGSLRPINEPAAGSQISHPAAKRDVPAGQRPQS